ncbi:MAG TPA: hypothetical protein VJ792_07595 [Candidatus Nitrosotalea sp.]|nr:hypothetical protein [Candidatus Nitrosotalea sp.]
MWDFFYARRALEFGQAIDMINSPFAFPRLPPRANSPLGISNAGRIKETIVQDKDVMMNRLSSHHEMFQRYSSGLFNLSPGPLQPTHPLQKMMNAMDDLKEENTRLRNENSTLKTNKTKEKKN